MSKQWHQIHSTKWLQEATTVVNKTYRVWVNVFYFSEFFSFFILVCNGFGLQLKSKKIAHPNQNCIDSDTT